MQENRQSLAPPPTQSSTSNDILDPSPSSSTGTDITDIDDSTNPQAEADAAEAAPQTPYVQTPYPHSPGVFQPDLSVGLSKSRRIIAYAEQEDIA